MSKILIVNSYKGGVGKTEATVAIAIELKSRGYSVVVLDLDVTTPNVDELDGVNIVSSRSNTIPTKSSIHRLLKEARKTSPDYIVVDTPPTSSTVTLTLMEKISPAPQLLFVTTPSRNAIKDTGLGIRKFASRGGNLLGVIQNMVGKDFGEEFDSIETFGIPTIGVIKLSDKDKVEKYKTIVDKLEPLIGVSDVVDQDNTAIMQNVTEKDIEEGIPLRFYNLETWELVREKLVKEDLEIAEYIGAGTRLSSSGKKMSQGDSISYGAKSQFDVPSEFIEKVLNAGEYANILVMKKVVAVGAPPRYAIEEAKVVWTQNISKGLPMFLCRNGALLWPREVSVLTKDTFEGLVSSDDYDEVDPGVYTPNFFTFLTMLRSFERTNPWEEVDELKTLFEYSSNKPDEKYFISGLAVLANEVLSEDAESFDINTDASVHFLSLYESYKPLFSGI